MQLPNEKGDIHIIKHLVNHGMPNPISSAFFSIPCLHCPIYVNTNCSLIITSRVYKVIRVLLQLSSTSGTKAIPSGFTGM